jgi:hypothetical protein
MRIRRSRSLLLPFALAAALLAGCSSAVSGNSSPADASTSSDDASQSAAAASSSAAAADADRKETFCTEVPGLLGDITDDLQAVYTDPERTPELMDEAVARLQAVEPPAEVTPQWQRLVTAWSAMRDLLAQADLTNPAANADLAPQLQPLQTELIDSGTAVDDYGKANC